MFEASIGIVASRQLYWVFDPGELAVFHATLVYCCTAIGGNGDVATWALAVLPQSNL